MAFLAGKRTLLSKRLKKKSPDFLACKNLQIFGNFLETIGKNCLRKIGNFLGRIHDPQISNQIDAAAVTFDSFVFKR